jgi:hypothetical protein
MAITWSPLLKSKSMAIKNNGMTAYSVSSSSYRSIKATHYLSGKGYFEVYIDFISAFGNYLYVGVAEIKETTIDNEGYCGITTFGWGFQSNGNKINNAVSEAYASAKSGDFTFQCAVDFSAGKVWFGSDGVWMGDPAAGTGEAYSGLAGLLFPMFSLNSYYGYIDGTGRFSAAALAYSPPTGFSAWDEVSEEFVVTGRTMPMPFPLRRDIEDGGPLSIIEPVTRLNTIPPQSRRVRLCDQRSGRLVREQWSDPTTGNVDFQYLREGPWVLYALDHTHEHESVAISDRLATADGSRP